MQPHVLILNWNGARDTIECLSSLPAGVRATVVDNGSAEDPRESFRGWDLLALPANLGFAGGMNAGIDHALKRGATEIVLLNNDTILAPDTIAELSAALADGAGIAGPVSWYAGDRGRVWASGGVLQEWTGLRRHMTDVPPGVTDRDYMPAVCWAVRREVFERIGLLPPGYWMYFEDAEFCVRARRAGFRVVCAPRARLWHKVSASTGGESNPTVKYYATRNRFRFVRRMGHAWAVPLLCGINATEIAVSLLKGEAARAKAVFRGVLAAFAPSADGIR